MNDRHPIRVVAKKTGLSPHLIRMWERRYNAVTPKRTESGHRLYSDADIEKLLLLKQVTAEGQAISQVAGLSYNQLIELLPASRSEPADVNETIPESIEHHLDLSLQAMKNLDAAGLEVCLLRASISLGQQVFLEKLLHPMLETTGEMWSDGRLKVAHEHLASAVIRSLLGSMQLSGNSESGAPLLLTTTPIGQQHEFGALMVSVAAATSGWRTIYLGPNLPTEDIAEAIKERQADAVALSIVYPPDDPWLSIELKKLYDSIAKNTKIIVGGRSAGSYDTTLNEIKAIKIEGLSDLKDILKRHKNLIGTVE